MVKKSDRPRGRPRHFDEAEALNQATKVFWAKGFDGATIDDLVEAMGVQRPTLYAVFGDKSKLFMRCMENYRSQLGAMAAEALLSPNDVRGAIRGLLSFSVAHATAEGSPWGCLLVCVAPLVEDERVQSFVALMGKQATSAVERRLQVGVDNGELPANFPVAVRARQTMDLSRGLVVRARIGVPREQLLSDAFEAANLLLGSD